MKTLATIIGINYMISVFVCQESEYHTTVFLTKQLLLEKITNNVALRQQMYDK